MLRRCVFMLIVLLFSFQNAVFADPSHHQVTPREGAGLFEGKNHTASIQVTTNPPVAHVGELTQIQGEIRNSRGELIPDGQVHLEIYHPEDDRVMYETTLPAPQGTFSLDYQFYDGAEHELRIEAQPAGANYPFELVNVQGIVEVEGKSPPTYVKIKTLLVFLSITALGMLAGYGFGRFISKKRGNRYAIQPST